MLSLTSDCSKWDYKNIIVSALPWKCRWLPFELESYNRLPFFQNQNIPSQKEVEWMKKSSFVLLHTADRFSAES